MRTPPLAQWLPFALPGVPRAPRRPRLPRARRVVTADFPGNACPVGSRVRFTPRRQALGGVVAELQHARAVVAASDGSRWKVPYALLTVVERVPERECTLAEVEALARELMARHVAESGLDADWGFGFDPRDLARRGLPAGGEAHRTVGELLPPGDAGRDRRHAAARDRPRHRRRAAPARRGLAGQGAPDRLHGRALSRRQPHSGPVGGGVRMRKALAAAAPQPQPAARRAVRKLQRRNHAGGGTPTSARTRRRSPLFVARGDRSPPNQSWRRRLVFALFFRAGPDRGRDRERPPAAARGAFRGCRASTLLPGSGTILRQME